MRALEGQQVGCTGTAEFPLVFKMNIFDMKKKSNWRKERRKDRILRVKEVTKVTTQASVSFL